MALSTLRNKSQFLLTRPAFEFVFTFKCGGFIAILFAEDHFNGRTASSVFAGLAFVVAFKPLRKVFDYAYIEGFVTAF